MKSLFYHLLFGSLLLIVFDAHAAESVSLRPAKVTIGPREPARARKDMPFVMDSSLATVRRDRDSWFFYHTVDWGNRIEKWRGTSTNPFQAKVWQKSRDQLFDLHGWYTNVHHAGLWLVNIHRMPDGNLLGVVHVELHSGKPAVNHGEKYALGLVFSSDGSERWSNDHEPDRHGKSAHHDCPHGGLLRPDFRAETKSAHGIEER